jgi:uncharacterized membrane protein
MRAALGALALLALCACDPPPLERRDFPCPTGGTTLTYASFGRDFLDARCNRCHAGDANPRHGAPEAYRFDSLDDVRAHADRIFVRAAATNVSMPPGPDDPPADQREDLAIWLACGAP